MCFVVFCDSYAVSPFEWPLPILDISHQSSYLKEARFEEYLKYIMVLCLSNYGNKDCYMFGLWLFEHFSPPLKLYHPSVDNLNLDYLF